MLKKVTNTGHLTIIIVLVINGFFIMASGCGDSASVSGREYGSGNVITAEDKTAYVNFRSFQNPDKTWGFTIFVNSMPFRQYSRIPYKRASAGFLSKDEAEHVATLFVSLIRSGDQSPKLDRKSVDTLGITISKTKTPPS